MELWYHKQGLFTTDNRKCPVMDDNSTPLNDVFESYQVWLDRQPLSNNTRRAYRTQVRQFCSFLEASAENYGDALSDPHARNYAVRDYKTYLKTERKLK